MQFYSKQLYESKYFIKLGTSYIWTEHPLSYDGEMEIYPSFPVGTFKLLHFGGMGEIIQSEKSAQLRTENREEAEKGQEERDREKRLK